MDIQDTSKELLDSVGKVLASEAKVLPDPFSPKDRKLNDKAITELLKAQKILVKLNQEVRKSKFVPNDKFRDQINNISNEASELDLESDMAQNAAMDRDSAYQRVYYLPSPLSLRRRVLKKSMNQPQRERRISRISTQRTLRFMKRISNLTRCMIRRRVRVSLPRLMTIMFVWTRWVTLMRIQM